MEYSIGKDFINQTKFRRIKFINKEISPSAIEWVREIDCKIPLPIFNGIDASLTKCMQERKSVRQYSDKPLSLAELSFLLQYTQGVKRLNENGSSYRMVPSAGARHPIETIIYANKVEGVPAGLYHYCAPDHTLEGLTYGSNIDEIVQNCRGQQFVADCAVLFIWVAVMKRSLARFGERAYRYIFLDAGHICENLYLTCQAINVGVCALGAYDDETMDEMLCLDGEDEFVIYCASVGHIKE